MLTVLSIAYPFAPVGADAVGGAEQVLTILDQALVEAGHRSLVIACEGSRVAGELLPLPPVPATFDLPARQLAYTRLHIQMHAALQRWPVDLVHLHGVDFVYYLPPQGVPVLVTLHLPPASYPPESFCLNRPQTYLHCVSAGQQAACPRLLNLLPPITNGVPLDRFRPRRRKLRLALALGRICPEKAFHRALDAARLAELPLALGGRVFPYREHQAYFEKEIRPRLDAQRRFVGPLGFARKRRLLAAARCLVVSSAVPETSSLVAMEALACGTPVVAFPAGGVAETVEHGHTGFLVSDVREMAAAMQAARCLDPEACRAAAVERFCARRMSQEYLARYFELARVPAPPPPRRVPALAEAAD